MADGGSFLARPLRVVSDERGILEGIGGHMGTVRHVRLPEKSSGRSLYIIAVCVCVCHAPAH